MDESNIFLTVKLAVTAAIGAFSSAFGWLGWLVLVWVLCMVADYITGSAAAAHSGEWSSAAARSGIWHKAGMMVVVAVSLGLDILIGMILGNIPAITLPFEYSVLVCPLVLVWYVLTELGSILENAGAMGAPMPAFLRKMLAALQGAAESTGDKLTGETDKK